MEDENAKFEYMLFLTELLEDFLKYWETLGNLNQPTILDFYQWLGDETARMSDTLGDELDVDGVA